MNLNGSFGNWLQLRRKALDLTQADLADQVGCSTILIRKIEADERRPSRQISEHMADVLAIALEDRAAFVNFARRITKPQPHLLDDLIRTVNLPPQTTSFIGRETEVAQIADRLNDPACRLLTLVGPGGIGKTRLAVQAVSDQVNKFADGMFFVSLTPVGSTTLIAAAIASTLQISFVGQENSDTQLVNYLRGKRLLLVLDNYEHLLGGSGLLADLLANAPHVKLLVTSRERLNMQEEWALPIAGLPFPLQAANGGISTGSYDAVQLFVQTARRIEPGFSLDAHAQAVVDICRAVEGMPLGLELAATWLRVMPCNQIAGQIRRNLDFLATPLRNVPERHRSLRAVFEHSWGLLSDAEHEAAMKLSVFRGDCDLDAAERVGGASLWLLAGLVDKSLVRQNLVGRYEMHELVRQFAEDKLLESGQSEEARHRHLQHYLNLAEDLEGQFFGPQHLASLDQFEAEHDNCRAALDWAWQVGEMESGLRLANALGWFWKLRTHWAEGRMWLDRFRQRSTHTPAELEARAIFFQLELAGSCGDSEQVIVLGAEALAWAEKVEDQRLKGQLLLSAEFHAYFPSNRYETALALFRTAGDQASECRVLTLLSQRALQRGEFNQADQWQEEGIRLARQTGNKFSLAELLMFSACSRWYQRIINQETLSLYHESLALHRELHDKCGILTILHCLGSIAHLQNETEQASVLFKSSIRLAQEIGSQGHILHGLISLSKILCARDAPERGARVLGAISDRVSSEYAAPDFWSQEGAADYEAGMTAARSRLGERAFHAAFTQGKHLSLEQAAALALSDTVFTPTIKIAHTSDRPYMD